MAKQRLTMEFRFPENEVDIGWKLIDKGYNGMLHYYSHQWQTPVMKDSMRYTELVVWLSDSPESYEEYGDGTMIPF
jgi:hypothetical protein